MRYQIYLSKDISNYIEVCALANGVKSCTFIKTYLETCFKAAMEAVDQERLIQTFGENLNNGNRERQK